jgi:hypothetical protein
VFVLVHNPVVEKLGTLRRVVGIELLVNDEWGIRAQRVKVKASGCIVLIIKAVTENLR